MCGACGAGKKISSTRKATARKNSRVLAAQRAAAFAAAHRGQKGPNMVNISYRGKVYRVPHAVALTLARRGGR